MIETKIHLYLDDVRTPLDPTWQVVRNYDEFVAHINLHGLENYQCISFDHDLGEEAMREYYRNVKPNGRIDYDNIKEKTGLDCAHWVVNKAISTGIYLPITYVHSSNPVGAENISTLLNNYYKKVGLSEKCVYVKVGHRIGEHMTVEELNKRWGIIMENN